MFAIKNKKMRRLFFVFIILLALPLISANVYGANEYGCGLFGIGCSDEVTSTAGGGGGGSKIQFDVKILEIDSDLTPGDYFDFTYFVKGVGSINHDVIIDFWIEDLEGGIVSSGSDVIYFGVNEEKTETASLLIPNGIESGIYILKVKATYQSITGESHRTIQIDVERGFVEQLLSISMFLEKSVIKNSDELISIIRFENFETTPAIVNLTYSILDEKRRKIYLEGEKISVETEEVLRKSFEGLNLPKGKYNFVLETLYGNDVYDKFEQEFEIEKISLFLLHENRYCYFIGILFLIVVLIVFVRLKHMKKSKKSKGVREYKKKVHGRLRKLNN